MGRRPAAPARGVTVRKYKSGREVIKITFSLNGESCREQLDIEPTKANIKFAENLLGSIKLEISKGTFDYAKFFPDSPRAKKSAEKFKSLGERVSARLTYLEEREILEKSTLATRWGYFKTHIGPAFGHLTLQELTVDCLREWIKDQTASIDYIKMSLGLLRPIIREGLVNGEIAHDPISLIDWSDLIPKARRTRRKESIDPLSQDEIRKILSACMREPDRLMYQLGFYTGLRIGELCVVEWENVDWSRKTMLINKAVGRAPKPYIKKTKKDQSRVIDLLPPAMDALEKLRDRSETNGGSGFIFPSTKDFPAIKPDNLYRRWQTAVKRAGIRYRHPNQMRHTFASLMLSRGENEFWVAKQLGHEDLEMLKQHYALWIGESKEQSYTPVNDWSATQ